MKIIKEIGFGLGLGLVSIFIVIGASILTVVEGNVAKPVIPAPTEVVSLLVTPTPEILQPTTSIPIATGTSIPVNTPSLPPTATIATPPSSTVTTLPLPSTTPLPSVTETLTLEPSTPTVTPAFTNYGIPKVLPTFLATQSAVSSNIPYRGICPPPPGWIAYTIQPQDTLEQISKSNGISSFQLVVANCLNKPPAILFLPGQVIYLPPLLTTTPSP